MINVLHYPALERIRICNQNVVFDDEATSLQTTPKDANVTRPM